MSQKKARLPVPPELVTEVMFRSDLTCCICHVPNKHVQTHHINEDPADNRFENLAVLCLEDHARTQLSGGFGRKLSADIVTRYRDDWLKTVEMKRAAESPRYKHEINSEPQREVSTSATHASPAQFSSINEQRNDDTDQSDLSRQMFRLADELNKQEKLTRQITSATNLLADITIEYGGALRRFALKSRTARNAPEVSRIKDELAEELLPIVTRYSTQLYSIRSIDNAIARGLEVQLEIYAQVPQAQWPEAMLHTAKAKKREIETRLKYLDSMQAFYVDVSNLKGQSSRLDSVLQHLSDAIEQRLNTRSSYENLLQKLDNFDT